MQQNCGGLSFGGTDMKRQEYIDFALSQGAENAVYVTLEQIVFDSRMYLKCLFGCPGSDPKTLCHSQPGRIKPWEYEDMLKKYGWGILIHSKDNKTAQRISLDLERKVFLDGYYLAFSLSDCDLCEDCGRLRGEACAHYADVRPAMHGAGIDVFKTARGLGLPIEILRSAAEDQNCYSLVLVE
jgi:predicted metal-binding protein